MRRLNWLDQVQYEARKLGRGPNARSALWIPSYSGTMPTCERCGGAPLHAIEFADSGSTWIEVVGRHLHRGSRMPADGERHEWTNDETDYFRIDFERPPSEDDFRRALRSVVMFRSEHFENDAAK